MVDVILSAGRDRSVRRRHPWVLSGAVDAFGGDSEPDAGAWVRVCSAEGDVLGFGHYSPSSSIRVRLLTFGAEPEDELLALRIEQAVGRRVDALVGDTNAVRLVNAEGDGLPGLVVDRFGDVCVVKLTSAGMIARRDQLAALLRAATGASVGYERSDPTAARREGMAVHQGVLWGDLPEASIQVMERDRVFEVDVVQGQKTGFYLDQRDHRDLVASLAADARVLDLFCYTGGFGVAASRGGAREITLVDSSAPALEHARRHLESNGASAPTHVEKADGFSFLREGRETYDLLILDPPPLARHRGDVKRAARAYKDLLLHAFRRSAPGALLLVFACSHHISAELLRKIAFGASLDARRSARVLRTLGAPADHPVSLDHPEGVYLNGLLLQA